MATCSGCSETSKGPRCGIAPAGATLLLLALVLLLGGCAGLQQPGEKGSLVRSDEVTKMVEAGTILPDHVYYYTGPEAEPEAIIAIRSGLTFQGRYWLRIDLTPGQLQAWNRRIDNEHRIRIAYEGAKIMGPDGKQVGIWYSLVDHTVIRFPDANTILIYTPGPLPRDNFLGGGEDREGTGRRSAR